MEPSASREGARRLFTRCPARSPKAAGSHSPSSAARSGSPIDTDRSRSRRSVSALSRAPPGRRDSSPRARRCRVRGRSPTGDPGTERHRLQHLEGQAEVACHAGEGGRTHLVPGRHRHWYHGVLAPTVLPGAKRDSGSWSSKDGPQGGGPQCSTPGGPDRTGRPPVARRPWGARARPSKRLPKREMSAYAVFAAMLC